MSKNSFPGFIQHPTNRNAHISINRPDPKVKQKSRAMEHQVAEMQQKLDALTQLVEKLTGEKLG